MKYACYQVKWVLRNLPVLKAGEWSDPIRGDVLASRVKKYLAPFIGPCELAGTVELRLAYCGLDGLFLKAYYTWGESPAWIGKMFCLDEKTVKKRIESALDYISNKWPKDQSYKDFREHRKSRNSGVKCGRLDK